MNMARAELLGWGVQVAYPNLTEASLSWALNEVLDNPRYKENTLEIASRLRDQLETPMERAIFWVEYVVRHHGAHFMQTSAQHLSAIEYYNVDVYATFAFVIFLVVLVPFLIVRRILKLFFAKSSKTSSEKKTK